MSTQECDIEETITPKQTRSKKIPALVRNAIKSQTVPPPPSSPIVKRDDGSDESEDDVVIVADPNELGTLSKIPSGRPCPGCYHCNWTGVNQEGYGCTLQYFGSQN